MLHSTRPHIFCHVVNSIPYMKETFVYPTVLSRIWKLFMLLTFNL